VPDIDLTRSHSLGLDGGRDAVEQVARELHDDLEVDYHWDEDTLRFDGGAADGRIEVREKQVTVAINLSMFLKPMKGRVESEAERYLDRHLTE